MTKGTVTLAPVLTNSALNLPISIWLSKPIVERIPYVSSVVVETNANYAKLPDFYVEQGTVGVPKPDVNLGSLGKTVIKQLIPGLNGGSTNGSGNLLQGVGNLLNGGGSKTNQPNQPATNQSPVNNFLNRIMK